jgi:hypothetical protein
VADAALDSPSSGAHASMHGARFGVRAAEDGPLTLLRANVAVAHVGCCCCHPPNACKCHKGLQGPCIARGPCVDNLQDHDFIKQIHGPNRQGIKKQRPPTWSSDVVVGQPAWQTVFFL